MKGFFKINIDQSSFRFVSSESSLFNLEYPLENFANRAVHAEGSICRGVSIVWFRRFFWKEHKIQSTAFDYVYVLAGCWKDSRDMYENLDQIWQSSWVRKWFSSNKHDVLWSLFMTFPSSCSWTSSLYHKLSRPCFVRAGEWVALVDSPFFPSFEQNFFQSNVFRKEMCPCVHRLFQWLWSEVRFYILEEQSLCLFHYRRSFKSFSRTHFRDGQC